MWSRGTDATDAQADRQRMVAAHLFALQLKYLLGTLAFITYWSTLLSLDIWWLTIYPYAGQNRFVLISVATGEHASCGGDAV